MEKSVYLQEFLASSHSFSDNVQLLALQQWYVGFSSSALWPYLEPSWRPLWLSSAYFWCDDDFKTCMDLQENVWCPKFSCWINGYLMATQYFFFKQMILKMNQNSSYFGMNWEATPQHKRNKCDDCSNKKNEIFDCLSNSVNINQ